MRDKFGDNYINLIKETSFMDNFINTASGNLINKSLLAVAVFSVIFHAVTVKESLGNSFKGTNSYFFTMLGIFYIV